MRYHHVENQYLLDIYGSTYNCDHVVYNSGTLYSIGSRGIVVIQQRYDCNTKKTWWGPIDSSLNGEIYLNPGFEKYFNRIAEKPVDGLYPTVTVRQIMWALKMKPLKKLRWETTFDHKNI